MREGVEPVIFPVRDLGRAKALFGALLGAKPYPDAPYYVGFRGEGPEIGPDPNGHDKGMTGPLRGPYGDVADIEERLQRLLDADGELRQAVTDVGGGQPIALVRDADGNAIGLGQAS